MDVEKRLRAFRRERQNKERLENVMNIIIKPFKGFRNKMNVRTHNKEHTGRCRAGFISLTEGEETGDLFDRNVNRTESDVSARNSDEFEDELLHTAEGDDSFIGLHGFAKYLTCLGLWTVPYVLLIKVGFGAVYFCVTALLFIYFNTRTRQKLPNEPSAYSVFNVDCQPIEGTLSSEDIEKQIRSGMMG